MAARGRGGGLRSLHSTRRRGATVREACDPHSAALPPSRSLLGGLILLAAFGGGSDSLDAVVSAWRTSLFPYGSAGHTNSAEKARLLDDEYDDD